MRTRNVTSRLQNLGLGPGSQRNNITRRLPLNILVVSGEPHGNAMIHVADGSSIIGQNIRCASSASTRRLNASAFYRNTSTASTPNMVYTTIQFSETTT